MHATLPLLQNTDFPALKRDRLTTLQVNLGYRCNQACLHCHVNAGPTRKEVMQRETVDDIVRFMQTNSLETLDITGGAPELNPHFR
ncbi:MAG: radical SAM protein, partial [Pseudomonadota bacterium]|nr:radical SAM protein [Pseudomonadota bacterium]